MKTYFLAKQYRDKVKIVNGLITLFGLSRESFNSNLLEIADLLGKMYFKVSDS